MAWSLSAGLKRLASLPLTGATWVLHRRLTGRRAVLHVPVDGGGDVRAVALWLDLLRGVAADPLVATVVLEIAGTPGGWSTCEDLRGVIADLRRAGKRVVAWIDAPGNASLWIASAADEVVVPPLAELELTGLGVETSYLRSALDRLGLEADVEAAGAYKSFGEPFRRTHPSPEAREALVALLGEVQDTVERDLAASRGVPRAQVRDWL
ncbi:MAG: S49 family peptidase, partial [Myxococcales bacterium]|nr:S49 family peptidase [Myxococcales bacterium]